MKRAADDISITQWGGFKQPGAAEKAADAAKAAAEAAAADGSGAAVRLGGSVRHFGALDDFDEWLLAAASFVSRQRAAEGKICYRSATSSECDELARTRDALRRSKG